MPHYAEAWTITSLLAGSREVWRVVLKLREEKSS